MDEVSGFGRQHSYRVQTLIPAKLFLKASSPGHQHILLEKPVPAFSNLPTHRRWLLRPCPGGQGKLRAKTLQQLLNYLSCHRDFQHRDHFISCLTTLNTKQEKKLPTWSPLPVKIAPPAASGSVCLCLSHRYLSSYHTFFLLSAFARDKNSAAG